jgi:ATP-dependent protease ClpP protease subunit
MDLNSRPWPFAEDRYALLTEFQVEAAKYPDAVIPPSLLISLAQKVPTSQFTTTDLTNVGEVYFIGMLDKGSSDEDGDSTVGLEFLTELRMAHRVLPPGHPVTIYISSGGGSVMLGLAIQAQIQRMRREGRDIIGHVVGYAFSSAFDILQHCDYRVAEPFAGLMTHEESFGIEGSSGQIAQEAAFSKKMEATQFEHLAKRTGRDPRYYRDKVGGGKSWFLTAQEALAEGLLDEVKALSPLPVSKVSPPPTTRKRARGKVAPQSALGGAATAEDA